MSLKAPSDASAPLKLVGAGKFDLAISYEPEFFTAAQQKLPVTAVASIVPVPLNALISLPGSGITSPGEAQGQVDRHRRPALRQRRHQHHGERGQAQPRAT